MRIDFNELKEISISGMNGGSGEIFAKLSPLPKGKVIYSRLPKGASIGTHEHKRSADINFVVSGEGKSFCGGARDKLYPGVCCCALAGDSHSIVNTGEEELVLFTVVVEP